MKFFFITIPHLQFLIFSCTNFNKLIIRHHSYPKPTKYDAFEQKITNSSLTYPTNSPLATFLIYDNNFILRVLLLKIPWLLY